MISLTNKHRRAGFTVVELILVISVLGFLASALIESSVNMSRVTSTGNVKSLLQMEGEKALNAMITDLKRSGFVFVNGKNSPAIITDGVADDPAFAAHDHPLPNQTIAPGDIDFGPLQEVVFVLPADMDGDGRPDMDIDGNGVPELDANQDGVRTEDPGDIVAWNAGVNDIDLNTGVVWSHDEISYTVVTQADGRNYLERRVNGANPRQIARDVERIECDRTDTDATVALGSLRVRIFFRTTNSAGALFRHMNEVTIKLRNGGLDN